MKIIKRVTLTFILLLLCTANITASAQNETDADTTTARILADMRKYFNTPDRDALYRSAGEYRTHALKTDNIYNYYKGWETEILYDVNFNRFYQAMKKTMRLSEEMHERGDREYYYNATHLIGIIHSIQGNNKLAEESFLKALNEMPENDMPQHVSIYMDLANVKMEHHPEEAMIFINKAVSLAEQAEMLYQYCDAMAFKTIIAFVMHDWKSVKQCYKLYTGVKEKDSTQFSNTYLRYANIARLTAEGNYKEAAKVADELTNIDKYKFKLLVYEAAKDTTNAFMAQKEYITAKDSITQYIQSTELQSAAHDLAVADAVSDARKNKAINIILGIIIAGSLCIIGILLYTSRKRKQYTNDLKKKNKELIIAQGKAEEAEKMKLSIMKNMSHEIRSPLNVISGFAQVIGNPEFQMSDTVRADVAGMVKKSTESIVKILNELLDISDSDAYGNIQIGNWTVSDLCETAADNCRKAVENGVEVVTENHTDEDTTIATDKQKLLKALDCLLENARKFTDKGSITICCQKSGNNLEISISDTGCGVAAHERDKIFEHFYKGDKYLDGIGLGLPLAKRIITQLNGEIWLDVNYKEGARFIVSLPIKKA